MSQEDLISGLGLPCTHNLKLPSTWSRTASTWSKTAQCPVHDLKLPCTFLETYCWPAHCLLLTQRRQCSYYNDNRKSADKNKNKIKNNKNSVSPCSTTSAIMYKQQHEQGRIKTAPSIMPRITDILLKSICLYHRCSGWNSVIGQFRKNLPVPDSTFQAFLTCSVSPLGIKQHHQFSYHKHNSNNKKQ